MFEFIAGAAVVVATLILAALIYAVRYPLTYVGAAAVMVGSVLTIGNMVVPGVDPTWPIYMILGGLASCLPALLSDF